MILLNFSAVRPIKALEAYNEVSLTMLFVLFRCCYSCLIMVVRVVRRASVEYWLS